MELKFFMQKLSERTLYSSKWLKMKESTFINKQGEEFQWESFERKHSPDVVTIIARMQPSNKYLLIKQFRPAINNYVIGFPAGICESSDLKEEILRELEEETGYSGTLLDVSPPLQTNPGLLHNRMILGMVEIDEDALENKHPKQRLEPEEDIEVMLVKRTEIREFLSLQIKKGYEIGAGLWYFFMDSNC